MSAWKLKGGKVSQDKYGYIYKYVVSFRSTTDPVNTWNRAVPWNFQQCGMFDQQGSDQQAHMDSLVRAFTSCLNILCLLSYWSNITRTA